MKVADLCHFVEVSESDIDIKKESNHGYCPPFKNVREKRFRKTMYNQDFAIEAEKISKELYYLLSTDLEAVRSNKHKYFHVCYCN